MKPTRAVSGPRYPSVPVTLIEQRCALPDNFGGSWMRRRGAGVCDEEG